MSDVLGAADDREAYAGFWHRLAAYAIDYLLVFVASGVLAAAAQLAGLIGESAQQLSLAVFAGYFLYYALLESSSWQATVGKRTIGLKVTNRHGERVGFARAAARFVARLLSVLTLCLGFLLYRRDETAASAARSGRRNVGRARRHAAPARVGRRRVRDRRMRTGARRARGDRAARVSGLHDPRASERGALARDGLSRCDRGGVAKLAARLRGPDVRFARRRIAAQRPLCRVDRSRLGHDRDHLRCGRERRARGQRVDARARTRRRAVRSAGPAATANRRRGSKPCSKDTPVTRPSSNATFHRCAANTRHEKPIVPAASLVRARRACERRGAPRTASRRTSSQPLPSSACCCGSSPRRCGGRSPQ